ncbi:DUF1902 domain-containing protein [Hoeflea sp. AS16]|uniref:DUF1902 domain-containing protein n=1 Tax=Hoeflea sp. AS16 TaxID=3135779 RepID=UPI0031772C56
MQRSFFVKAVWDDEAQVYVSESDIIGLHIEAATVEEFEAVMCDVATDLVIANHISSDQLNSLPLRDLIPTIVWERPNPELAA